MVMNFAIRCSLLKVLIIVCELQLCSLSVNAQSFYCPNTTTYSQNSTYQANLGRLLSDLSSDNAANKLFLNATVGDNSPENIYGLSLCRGDLSIDECRECLQKVTREIVEPQRCPKEKNAIIWYDECMLRYSNQSFFGNLDYTPTILIYNVNDVSNQDHLEEVLGEVMDGLINRASGTGNVGSLKGYATGESNFTSLTKLYNLVQCTPDLSGLECNKCLREALPKLPPGKKGGSVLCPSCKIRYDLFPFYNIISPVSPPPTTPTSPPPPASPAPPPPSPDQVPDIGARGSRGLSAAVIVAIVVPLIVLVVLVTVAFCFLRPKAKKQHNALIDPTSGVSRSNISAAESFQFDLNSIKLATNNFSADNKIGKGGFGEVFKGTLNNKKIAVKRLSKGSGQGQQEFKNEVLLLAKLEHRNLVRLLGYCLDKGEKLLIYEFVPNKSLDFILFDKEKQQCLDWSRRYHIIGGVARGILYLHEDSRLRIIHRDLKASNVLLDRKMNAKIADFGLARLVAVDESQLNTNRIVGTFGYMPPEYALHGLFSVKSDVFSFGVLLLEIVSGKKNTSFNRSGSSDDLLSYAWKLWRDGRPLDLMDPSLGKNFVRNEVIRCIHMGLLCVQEDPVDRPTMASVVLMLSSYSVTLPLPHQPAYYLSSRTTPTNSTRPHSNKTSSKSKSLKRSVNDVSITDLYPR